MGRYSQVVSAKQYTSQGSTVLWHLLLQLCELDQLRLSLAVDQSDSLIVQNSLTDCFVDYIVSLRLNGLT